MLNEHDSRAGVSSLIWKELVWVQVFIATKQKPHCSLLKAQLIKQVILGVAPESRELKKNLLYSITFL